MPQNGVEAELRAMGGAGKLAESGRELLGGGGAQGDVAELATGSCGLAVQVKVRVTHGQDFRGIGDVADEIEHRRAAQSARRA